MITNFNEQLFIYTKDANIAIFIENLASWIKFNATKENPELRNFHEGRYWSFSSYPQLVKYFNIWSIRQIRVIVDNCVKAGLLIVGNFNKKRYDNTNWYTLSDKALEFYPVLAGLILNTPVNSDSTPVNSDRPIPEDNTHTRSKSFKTLVDSSKSTDYTKDDLFKLFYDSYPNKQKPRVAHKAFRKLKPNAEFVNMLVDDVKKRIDTVWKGRHKNKIPHPATYLNAREWEGEIYEAETNLQSGGTRTYTLEEVMNA